MKSRQAVIKNADRYFSLYVRKRGSTYDYNNCFTCGVYMPIWELQAGHFIPRRYMNTRWHPVNVWPQCNHCNVELGGNLAVYEKKLIAQFSKEAVEELWILARRGNSITEEEIKEIVKLYKKY